MKGSHLEKPAVILTAAVVRRQSGNKVPTLIAEFRSRRGEAPSERSYRAQVRPLARKASCQDLEGRHEESR
ncbi:hypothetical protein NDU88_002887 [Pleurodeles waltl]|uniref:Uncharacterized protein n=1 Tax=Pleurodeles waltl TaxID=8319 RepID=A0AAV7UB58_PLEWA|nr:hypothetical protein NDU88_002887 [Pleurodeles waltl]